MYSMKLLAIQKEAPDSRWLLTLDVDGERVRFRYDEIQIGIRLAAYLKRLEEVNKIFPISVHYDNVPGNHGTVRKLGGKVSYVEVDLLAMRTFPVESNSPFHEYGSRKDDDKPKPAFAVGLMRAAQMDSASTKGMVVLTNVRVKDGDTIAGTVYKVGSMFKNSISEGKSIDIRLAGLNTPETKEHGESKGNERNKEYCQRYKVTPEAAFKIGAEAMEYLQNMLSGSGAVVVDLDSKNGRTPSTDTYGRYLGAVYKTNSSNSKVLSGDSIPSSIHLNKSLLAQPSKIYAPAPLAMPYEKFAVEDGYVRLDVIGWYHEVGVVTEVNNGGTNSGVGEALNNYFKDGEKEKTKVLDTDDVVVKYDDAFDNTTQFLAPLDDRIDLLEDASAHHRVRIGDVLLTIPPLAIQVNHTSHVERIKALRTKGSILTKSGSASTTITLQLYFHDLDSINGHAWDNGKGAVYSVDGLRPLIAQFQKAPFLPIDSPYINATLDIHDVALMNLTLETVPGFPHSMMAVLTLAKFDVSAYMPQEISLRDSINYPLLRWYYQRSLSQPANSAHTYLEPISGPLTNSFKFSHASEADLEQRAEAIVALRQMKPVTVMKLEIDTKKSEMGKLIADGKKAENVIKQYENFLKAQKKYGSDISVSPDIHNNDKAKAAWKDVYGNRSKDDVTNDTECFIPARSTAHEKLRNQIKGGGYKNFKDRNIIKIFIWSVANADKFRSLKPCEKVQPASEKGAVGYFYVTEAAIPTLRQIVERGKRAESMALSEIDKVNKLSEVVALTEGQIPMVDYDIEDKDMIVTSMQVMYENMFSSAQTRSGEAPTLQFLGSQDVAIKVNVELTEDGVGKLKTLVDMIDGFARQYRVGITSGFLGVQNQLFNLFGVKYAMIETLNISTVPGFPGRFTGEMIMVAFNKTQRRHEELKAMSGYDGRDREDLHAGTVNYELQDAIVEYKMDKMEVYPDLELPTYEELNAALKTIGAGIDKYPNIPGGSFVDPDFYAATKWTMRTEVQKQLDARREVRFQDSSGLTMKSQKGSEEVMKADKENLAVMNDLEKKTPYVPYVFSWAEDNKGAAGNADKAGDGLNAGAKGSGKANAEVEAWLKDKKNYETPPPAEEWKKWGYGSSDADYTKWMENVAPQPFDFYKELYKLIDDRWLKHNNVYNDKNKKEGGHTEISYMTPDEHFKVYEAYRDFKSPATGGITHAGAAQKNMATKHKEYMPTTRMRIGNFLKAFFHHQNKWNGFTNTKKPYVNGNFGGLAKVDIANFTSSTADAQRFLWDWKYQLKVVVDDIYKFYVQARDSKEKEFEYRAWDYMIAGFYIGELKKDSIKEGIFPSVMNVWKTLYNGDNNRYRTPVKAVDYDVMKLIDGKSDHSINVAKSDKAALIKDLKDSKILEEVVGKEKANAILKDLESKSTGQVRTAYETFMKFKRDGKLKGYMDQYMKLNEKFIIQGPNGLWNWIGAKAGELLIDGWSWAFGSDDSAIKQVQGKEPSQETKNFNEQQNVQEIQAEERKRLLSTTSPEDAFDGMFSNMFTYDMRGRLCRAFPTFQFFIIDEGRWMGTYRLWDNFYGFNSIQSIDVHKSRKQAADTAIISMTNVYSNLTARPMSDRYESFAYSFWDNIVLNNPNDAVLDARSDLLSNMMLEVGARVHLRMGYGSSVRRLPTVFNGTITEMDTDDIVTIVAQGDGLELTSVISGDPSDKTQKLFTAQEPRDIICQLLTSKGNWINDMVNSKSDNRYFRDNPLGIAHFGRPDDKTPTANVDFFSDDYGEAAQNIYSANGLQTFSQWIFQDGTSIPMKWDGFIPKFQGGDEDNILLTLYNQTTWDVASNISYCYPDYIVAVHPFETRSTLFFGKPYWNMAYRYNSTYSFNEKENGWERTLDLEHRKPFSQFHYVDTHMDIVQNRMKASKDGMYTIVVGSYGGKPTMPVYADYDINFSHQRTAVIELPLVSRTTPGLDHFTTEKQAIYYCASTLRDYLKDMYQGNIMILGTPTLKPHDMVYLSDNVSDMNGTVGVESVIHHFSHESGFITNFTPDAMTVIDDKAMLAHGNWFGGIGMMLTALVAGYMAGNAAARRFMASSTGRFFANNGKKGGEWIVEKSLKKLSDMMPDTPETKEFNKALESYYKAKGKEGKNEAAALKRLEAASAKLQEAAKDWLKSGGVKEGGKIIKGSKNLAARTLLTASKVTEAAKDGKKAFRVVKGVGTFATKANPLGIIASLTVGWLVESLFEQWRRSKTAHQACLVMPIMYQGRALTAGINGHKGLVVGDDKGGALDNFFQGMGFDGSGDGFFAAVGGIMNFLADEDGEDRKFTTSYEDLENFGK